MKMMMPKDFSESFKNYDKVAKSGRYNTGKKTIILASSSPASDKKGFCIGEHSYGRHMAQYIKNSGSIHKVLGISSRGIYTHLKATSFDLYSVLNDRTIENIILVGHANYEMWTAIDATIHTNDIGEQTTDHLKKGVFVNAGCAKLFKDSFLPLGTFAVKDWEKIYGVPKGKLLDKNDIKNANFVKHEVLLGDFIEYYDKEAYDKLIAQIDKQIAREMKMEGIIMLN